jgi:RNA polymerase sigma-70 factor (ECF subfamily)
VNGFVTIRLSASTASKKKVQTSDTAWQPSDVLPPADETLLARVREGQPEQALALLFRRYARIVRGVAYRILRDASEADDLLQDIFVLIPRLCRTFDSSRGSARTWILQMTYRRALCRRRYLTTRHFYKRLDLDKVADELVDPNKTGFDNTLDGTFGTGKGEQAFAALSESQRETLQLHFIEGYTLTEIAQKLGQSTGNVKNHYFRGLERLRKELLGSRLQRERAVS